MCKETLESPETVALYIQLNRTVRTRRTPDFTHRLQISLIGSKDQCDKRIGRKCVHYFDFALDDAGVGGGGAENSTTVHRE